MIARSLLATAFATVCITGFSTHALGQAMDAGCGLGSMIIKEDTKLMQLFAATTNGITGTTLFGISTGTSNCRAQNFVMREKAVRYFTEVNKDDLTREMAQGRGEKLSTLASLYGCKGESNFKFANMTQASYAKIVTRSNATVGEIVENLDREVKQNPELSGQCESI